jgi:hypothetical protein
MLKSNNTLVNMPLTEEKQETIKQPLAGIRRRKEEGRDF